MFTLAYIVVSFVESILVFAVEFKSDVIESRAIDLSW